MADLRGINPPLPDAGPSGDLNAAPTIPPTGGILVAPPTATTIYFMSAKQQNEVSLRISRLAQKSAPPGQNEGHEYNYMVDSTGKTLQYSGKISITDHTNVRPQL